MRVDIQKITEGEESVVIRYIEPNPTVGRIIDLLEGKKSTLWGRRDGQSVCIYYKDILYLEMVDDKLFAYTIDDVVRIDGSLNSFVADCGEDYFFRCSKSMIINVNLVNSLKSLSSNRIVATMESGEQIIISRRYASEFRRLLKGDR